MAISMIDASEAAQRLRDGGIEGRFSVASSADLAFITNQ